MKILISKLESRELWNSRSAIHMELAEHAIMLGTYSEVPWHHVSRSRTTLLLRTLHVPDFGNQHSLIIIFTILSRILSSIPRTGNVQILAY